MYYAILFPVQWQWHSIVHNFLLVAENVSVKFKFGFACLFSIYMHSPCMLFLLSIQMIIKETDCIEWKNTGVENCKHSSHKLHVRNCTTKFELSYHFFISAVRDKLFARSFNESGLDLTAVNNQRGREHGK